MYQESRDKAIKYLRLADHMLNVTYPLIKDPKLLLKIVDQLFLALTNSMAAILYYEAEHKRLPLFKDDFQTKFNLLKTRCAERLKIDKIYLTFILDIKNIVMQHKKSQVEFVRKDKIVICLDDYQYKSIGKEMMKSHLKKTREFVYHMNNIVNENVRLFGEC